VKRSPPPQAARLCGVPFTLVSFHAHPDDEALLTAGTLARAAAEGHRVVLVVATAGEAGLAATSLGDPLGARRLAELEASAAALGCARVVCLGYPDSGMDGAARGPRGEPPFADVSVPRAAARLAALLEEERAHVLTTYDANGGYGHPDHVQVHRVGAEAARLAGTPVVLQATVAREPLAAAARWLARVPRLGSLVPPDAFATAYLPRSAITHRVDVRRYCGAKRAAMRAHASQATADAGPRTLALLGRLPGPLYRRVLGYEWFAETARLPPGPPLDDIFATLRAGAPAAPRADPLP
jgi:LmbE family N-acetylglucosaminyl deacetylase